MGGSLELFHVNLVSLILTFAVFGTLLVILSKYVWGPVLKALDERDNAIRDDLDQAEHSKEEAQKLLKEHEKAMSDLREEGRKIREQAKQQAENQKQELIAAAEIEAEKIMQKTRQQLEADRLSMLEDVKSLTVEVAVDLAQKMIVKEVDKDSHKELIKQSLSDIEAAYKKTA
ncbi:MAG: F0F1 ATP synthase subunit B [Planctomycetes bacterium]|nr:F0F1 ATP synthase subunit B [Planctomycetota bacterium]